MPGERDILWHTHSAASHSRPPHLHPLHVGDAVMQALTSCFYCLRKIPLQAWFCLVVEPQTVSFGLSVTVKQIGPVKMPNFMTICTQFLKYEKELQDAN